MTNPELLGDYLRDCARELQLNDEVDREVDILFELRAYMAERQGNNVWSSEFTEHLNALADGPWKTYNHASREISQSQVSRKVGIFVRTKSVRKGGVTEKGWTYDGCKDAFSRYLPPEETAQATQPSNHNEKQQSEKRHQAAQVSDVPDRCQKVSDNGKANGSHRYADVSDVSDNGQGIGGEDLPFDNPDFGERKKIGAYDNGLEI